MSRHVTEFLYACQSCGARLAVKVPFKGRLVWTIAERDPDFGSSFPELAGAYGKPKLTCSADPLHETGFHLIDGGVERNLASNVWG